MDASYHYPGMSVSTTHQYAPYLFYPCSIPSCRCGPSHWQEQACYPPSYNPTQMHNRFSDYGGYRDTHYDCQPGYLHYDPTPSCIDQPFFTDPSHNLPQSIHQFQDVNQSFPSPIHSPGGHVSHGIIQAEQMMYAVGNEDEVDKEVVDASFEEQCDESDSKSDLAFEEEYIAHVFDVPLRDIWKTIHDATILVPEPIVEVVKSCIIANKGRPRLYLDDIMSGSYDACVDGVVEQVRFAFKFGEQPEFNIDDSQAYVSEGEQSNEGFTNHGNKEANNVSDVVKEKSPANKVDYVEENDEDRDEELSMQLSAVKDVMETKLSKSFMTLFDELPIVPAFISKILNSCLVVGNGITSLDNVISVKYFSHDNGVEQILCAYKLFDLLEVINTYNDKWEAINTFLRSVGRNHVVIEENNFSIKGYLATDMPLDTCNNGLLVQINLHYDIGQHSDDCSVVQAREVLHLEVAANVIYPVILLSIHALAKKIIVVAKVATQNCLWKWGADNVRHLIAAGINEFEVVGSVKYVIRNFVAAAQAILAARVLPIEAVKIFEAMTDIEEAVTAAKIFSAFNHLLLGITITYKTTSFVKCDCDMVKDSLLVINTYQELLIVDNDIISGEEAAVRGLADSTTIADIPCALVALASNEIFATSFNSNLETITIHRDKLHLGWYTMAVALVVCHLSGKIQEWLIAGRVRLHSTTLLIYAHNRYRSEFLQPTTKTLEDKGLKGRGIVRILTCRNADRREVLRGRRALKRRSNLGYKWLSNLSCKWVLLRQIYKWMKCAGDGFNSRLFDDRTMRSANLNLNRRIQIRSKLLCLIMDHPMEQN